MYFYIDTFGSVGCRLGPIMYMYKGDYIVYCTVIMTLSVCSCCKWDAVKRGIRNITE